MPRQTAWQRDKSRDLRGRYQQAPAILHYGFRLFFLLASLHAGLAIPAWLWMLFAGAAPPGPFSGLGWHVHEMLFGYVAAVVAGFILTAIPNWTGRFPLSGPPLAGLAGLWVLGRLACMGALDPAVAMTLDLLFPVTIALVVWREILSGRNWRNAPVAVLLSLFTTANALHHLEAMGLVAQGVGVRLALGVIALMLALIGGRITPSFTRNWLAANGHVNLPAKFGDVDRAALVFTAGSLLMWQFLPDHPATGFAFLCAGVLLLLRLSRWSGARVLGNPIVAILHLGYAWLAISFCLMGSATLWPDIVPFNSAIHALTAGAVGTMTLAVMTRASLGHTGREIRTDPVTATIYLLVTIGALLRVLAPAGSADYRTVLVIGGVIWSGAFLLFAFRYGPVLWSPGLARRATQK